MAAPGSDAAESAGAPVPSPLLPPEVLFLVARCFPSDSRTLLEFALASRSCNELLQPWRLYRIEETWFHRGSNNARTAADNFAAFLRDSANSDKFRHCVSWPAAYSPSEGEEDHFVEGLISGGTVNLLGLELGARISPVLRELARSESLRSLFFQLSDGYEDLDAVELPPLLERLYILRPNGDRTFPGPRKQAALGKLIAAIARSDSITAWSSAFYIDADLLVGTKAVATLKEGKLSVATMLRLRNEPAFRPDALLIQATNDHEAGRTVWEFVMGLESLRMLSASRPNLEFVSVALGLPSNLRTFYIRNPSAVEPGSEAE
ncbi:hypothetical protein DFJ74DRAFT_647455 [Hyaloraphidium curvatum]|nr:hypothetical protein DFJ74DRAFT_647455 [Hyaloraphidium curvatum]